MDTHLLKGADLWIIPDITNSPYRNKIEWALNFQIAKSLEHKPAKLDGEIQAFLNQMEATEFSLPVVARSPWTLISVSGLLPAKWLLYSSVIEGESFGKELDKAWSGLNRPATRIFTSQVWTKEALKRLKSECLKAESTEIVNPGG